MPEKKSKKARPAAGTKRRRKPAGASVGLTASELQAAAPPGEVVDLHQAIDQQGGKTLSVYREPYGARWVVLAALPIDLVEPTPYQRNLSDTHVRKLESVIGKLGRFLDPIIAVRGRQDEKGIRFWTPNGHHRLSAMRTLGAKSIIAIVVPEPNAAYQILALNTDASVQRLKGPKRPLLSEQQRAAVALAIEAVDAVTLFDEDTPRELIAEVLPDFLVKGADWSHFIAGREEVEAAGGQVLALPLEPGYSTTNVVEEILKRSA